VTAEDLQGVKIVFWHIWAWESGEALQTLADEFNITNEYGLRIQTVIHERYSDLNRSLDEAWSSDERPHLVVGFTNQLNRWATRPDSISDLQPYIADPVWGYSPEEVADFYPAIWEQDLLAGKRLGLPAQRTMQVLFYNETWAEELGFTEPPATIEAFTEQACAAAGTYFSDEDPTNDGLGGWVIDTSTTTLLGWIAAFGGEVETPQGYQFGEGEVTEALAFIKDLYDRGCAWLSANRYPNAELAARQSLFISSSLSGLPFQQEAFDQVSSEDKWTVLPFPSRNGQPVVPLTGPSFAMIKTTPAEQLGTWLFLKWVLEPGRQARWVTASGHLPSRASARTALESYESAHPQWASALALLPYSQIEPRHASWGVVRWALSDAGEQIYRLGLTLDQIPALQEELDQTAVELHAQTDE
jgi:ABC-type glycerol-3-phosphate transport system substrate-binding protein